MVAIPAGRLSRGPVRPDCYIYVTVQIIPELLPIYVAYGIYGREGCSKTAGNPAEKGG